MNELNSVRFALIQERRAKEQLEYLVEAKTLELYEVSKVLTSTTGVLEEHISYRTQKLQKTFLQQKLLAEISCSLNLLENFEGQIRDALRKMGQHAELDRIYIFETDVKEERVVNKFAWCRPNVEIDTANFEQAILAAIPCCKEHLSSGERVVASHLSALSEECAAAFGSQGVRSILIIPIFVRNEFYGFIGFDTCYKYKDWDESEVNLLQTVSNLIGHAYERVITKRELIAAKEAAEAAAKATTEFLSTMSHEIRTPMNAVIGLSHLLMHDAKPEQIDNLKTLKFASENLFSLINDVLDLNKIDAGKIDFEQTDFNFDTLLDGIEHSFAINAKKNNTQFIIEKSADVPHSLNGDPTRLIQVLTNLVSNALKFTKDGLVVLKINALSKDSKKVQLQFEVNDTGIGIPADKLKSIFEPFKQAEMTTTRKFGGTGLGLSIIQKLLKLQNSDIQVESTPGKGTTFSFQLTFGTNKTAAIQPIFPAPATKDDLKGLRVLLVEDTDLNVIVATQFLTKWGVIIDLAENGKIAVQKAKRQPFDLILMDLQMPVMNGFEATKAIRQLGGRHAKIPIVALTASAELAVRREALEHDMNDYIAKPFKPKELYATIQKNTTIF